MANLKDLNFTSILDMSNDEALEHIRQARLRRRVEKKAKSSTTKKTTAKKPTFDLASLSEADKQELLALLGEDE
jgi:hypothetical protein